MPPVGEVAERSKALDWNSSYIFTGVRRFESSPLRHFFPLRPTSNAGYGLSHGNAPPCLIFRGLHVNFVGSHIARYPPRTFST